MPYVTSWERIAQKRGEKIGKKIGEQRGERRGKRKGLKEGKLAVVLSQLRRRVGALDEMMKERVGNLSSARLTQLGDALLDFTKPADLERWLKRRKA